MSDICILATGGTIDKDHDPISEQLIFSEFSHIPEMLSEYRSVEIPIEVLMLKDSLDINDQDRDVIKNAILKRPESSLVVTHGTSTMTETAMYLADKVNNKTIVLTGAMRPFSLFSSDAGFNLGGAVMAARTLDYGIYICMNGQIFDADEVQKDMEKGIFVSKLMPASSC